MNWSDIAKYIFAESSKKEKETFEKWMNKDPENKELVERLTVYLNDTKMEEKRRHIDVDKAWGKLKNRIEDSNEKATPTPTPVIKLNQRIMKYAAIVLVILGVGTLGYFSYETINQYTNYVSIETQKTEKKESLYLPDGSIASLNGASKINYPKEFDKKERVVNLTGEAFFEVQRNESKPFVIKANKAKIKVLGTSFNVRTNLPNNAVEVYVQSGKVKFYKASAENKGVILEPGFVGILENNKLRKRRNDDINYLAWKTGKLLFKNNDLGTVVEKLNHTYNVNIRIQDPAIKEFQLSASFNNEPVDKVLQVITRTFNLELEKKNKNEYVLKI